MLRSRIERLDGCSGHWVLICDGEPEQDSHYSWRQTPDRWLDKCLENHWRELSLGFVPSYIAYSSYSNLGLVGRANFNVFTDQGSTPDPFDAVHVVDYGWDGQGVCIDVLYVTEDMLETIEALEAYPLISEEEHSQLELEAQDEAWIDWAREEFRKAVARELQRFEPSIWPDEADDYWAEEILDAIPDETLEARLLEEFNRLSDQAGEYWVCEDTSSGAYINVAKVAEGLTTESLEFITGIPYDRLVPEEQQWRREPYPWPGAEAAPLLEPPTTGGHA